LARPKLSRPLSSPLGINRTWAFASHMPPVTQAEIGDHFQPKGQSLKGTATQHSTLLGACVTHWEEYYA
jgi:hypothetical protein